MANANKSSLRAALFYVMWSEDFSDVFNYEANGTRPTYIRKTMGSDCDTLNACAKLINFLSEALDGIDFERIKAPPLIYEEQFDYLGIVARFDTADGYVEICQGFFPTDTIKYRIIDIRNSNIWDCRAWNNLTTEFSKLLPEIICQEKSAIEQIIDVVEKTERD